MTVKFYAQHEGTGRRVSIEQDDQGEFTLTCRSILGLSDHVVPDPYHAYSWDDALNQAEIHLEHEKCPHLGDVL